MARGKMSLLNDSWRKLRLLFEEDEDAAPADEAARPAAKTVATGPAGGSAAARAAARRARKLDMQQRLAAMIRPDGSIQGGIVKFVNLYPIAAKVGERWPIVFPKVELMSESVIRRECDPWDLWALHDDKGFALIFTDPNLTDEQADARCLAIFEAIREHLLGQVHVGRAVFNISPRMMLRALHEGGEPPLVMKQPPDPGAWIPPAAELAKRAVYRPPEGGAIAADAAPGPGPAFDASAATPAAEGWVTAPESAERTLEVGRSDDKPVRDIAVGRSFDRSDRAIEVGRSDDKPSGIGEWSYATSEQRRETIAAWDGKYEAPEEFDAGLSRDKRAIELKFEIGETEEQAIARYVTMGRFNTMFDAIAVRFRSFWAPRHEAVTTYLADARLRADDIEVGQAILVERANEVAAIAALDIAVLARTLEAVVPRIEAGARFLFAIPVAYPTLLRRADRYAYFDHWAAIPEAVRRFGRFFCYQPTSEIGDIPLAEVVNMLTRAGRTPIFANPLAPAALDRARSLRIKAIGLDASALDGDFEQVRTIASIARRYGMVTFFQHVAAGARRRAIDGEASLIEGALLPGPDALPQHPETLPADAFAAGADAGAGSGRARVRGSASAVAESKVR